MRKKYVKKRSLGHIKKTRGEENGLAIKAELGRGVDYKMMNFDRRRPSNSG